MLNGYKGIGEITLHVLMGLDRIQVEIEDREIPYWVDIQNERQNHTIRPDEFSIKKWVQKHSASAWHFIWNRISTFWFSKSRTTYKKSFWMNPSRFAGYNPMKKRSLRSCGVSITTSVSTIQIAASTRLLT